MSGDKPTRESTKERNARFVEAYFANRENATEAYLAVKPNVARNSAAAEGHKLLKIPEIQKAVEKRRAELRAQFALTSERAMQELARVAYFNPAKLLKGGALDKIDDDTAAPLTLELDGKGNVLKVRTPSPAAKNTAIEKAAKILRLYDKPPPPPPDETGRQVLRDPREVAKRMAFLLRAGAAADEKAQAKPAKPAKKKLTLPA